MIGVCITAKNEAETIGDIVSSLGDSVYVMDDGSTDNTYAIAVEAGAKVLRHDRAWGIGPSLMQLWRLALKDGCERIAQLDAGGSHSVDDLAQMFWASDSHSVVVGSRFLPTSRYVGSPFRRYMSRLASSMCNLAHMNAHHTDWSSGYRVYSAVAAEQLLRQRYSARMHGWQIETLAWAEYLRMSITEVPITYIAGTSSFNLKCANEAFVVWLHFFNHLGTRKPPR